MIKEIYIDKLLILIPVTFFGILLGWNGIENDIIQFKAVSSILIWLSILGWMIRYKDLKEKHKFYNLEKAPKINSSGFRLTHKEKLDYTIESNKIAKFSAKRDALSNDAKKEKWNKKIRKSEEFQKNIMDATKIIAQKVNSDIWSIKP